MKFKIKNTLTSKEAVIVALSVSILIFLGGNLFGMIGAIIGGALGGLITHLILKLIRRKQTTKNDL